MTGIIDFILYSAHDILICITLILATGYLLGGKFRKNIPGAVIVPLLILAGSLFGNMLFTGTEEDKLIILDIISSLCYFMSVFFFTESIRAGKRIWFLLLSICTMEMFFSLFAPYIPDTVCARSIVYIFMYSLMLFFILYTKKHSPVNIMPQVFDTIPRPVFAAVLFFDMTGYYKSFGESYAWYNVLYIISTIGVIVCVLFFMFRIFSLTYQQNEILRQFNEQKAYSERMLKGDENLRHFRHDYRNHMIVVNAFLESGSTDRAREYINAINSDISGTLNKISTGNVVADALINSKAVTAAQSGKKISFGGQIPREGIDDKDLCTILGNLLDNALEAVAQLQGNEAVTVEAAVRNGNFILSVSNPVIENVKIGRNNTIKTTKLNKADHGIGTKNIMRAVSKYKGSVVFDCQNKVFTADVRLKLSGDVKKAKTT